MSKCIIIYCNYKNISHFCENALFILLNLLNQHIVNTQFCGTRKDPNARGFIQGRSLNNFTPKDMMLGMLHGIVDDLFLIYKNANDDCVQSYEHLIGSGNGIRQNKTLQQIVSAKFHKPLKIPVHKEEAAFGAILFSLTSIGTFTSIEQAQKMIR